MVQWIGLTVGLAILLLLLLLGHLASWTGIRSDYGLVPLFVVGA